MILIALTAVCSEIGFGLCFFGVFFLFSRQAPRKKIKCTRRHIRHLYSTKHSAILFMTSCLFLLFFLFFAANDTLQHVQGPAGRASAALVQLIREYLDVERSFAGILLFFCLFCCPQADNIHTFFSFPKLFRSPPCHVYSVGII